MSYVLRKILPAMRRKQDYHANTMRVHQTRLTNRVGYKQKTKKSPNHSILEHLWSRVSNAPQANMVKVMMWLLSQKPNCGSYIIDRNKSLLVCWRYNNRRLRCKTKKPQNTCAAASAHRSDHQMEIAFNHVPLHRERWFWVIHYSDRGC